MVKAKYLFSLIILFLFSHAVVGQVLNIERLRLERDTTTSFKSKITAGMNIYNRSSAANEPVNLFGYNIDVNTLYYPGKHAFMGLAKFDYLKINEEDFLNFGFVHFRVNYFRKKTINFENYIQYSYDNFRGLLPRLLGGGGIRWNTFKSKSLSLVIGIGALYEYEKWTHPETNQTIEIALVKSSNYISFRWTANESVDINFVGYYQTGYDRDISAFRNRANASLILNTKIARSISFANSFDISYEHKPIVPITRTIYTFKTGLSFDF